jgi:hypothetical protein
MGVTDPRMRALILSRATNAMRPGSVLDAPAKPARKRRFTGSASARKQLLRVVRTETGGIVVQFPLYTTTESNTKGHWAGKANRAEKQREAVALVLAGPKAAGALPALPAVVTFTRIGKKRMDDDNLASAFKHVRDQLAETYGVDDASDLYGWRYDQEIGAEYGVRITIEPRAEGESK